MIIKSLSVFPGKRKTVTDLCNYIAEVWSNDLQRNTTTTTDVKKEGNIDDINKFKCVKDAITLFSNCGMVPSDILKLFNILSKQVHGYPWSGEAKLLKFFLLV